MEFPGLGQHCYKKSCNLLDFLPMKCDACSNIFCKDHIFYTSHDCENAYKKNVQVPVCPLCNKPVPSNRGEQPDIAVGQHIDRDCQNDEAIANRKIYTNKCSLKGCKQKELIPVTCSVCRRNYCLKHRHPTDHKCQQSASSEKQISPAGAAALARIQNLKNNQSSKENSSRTKNFPSSNRNQALPSGVVQNAQAELTEDEALAFALQKSVIDTSSHSQVPKEVQEEEDRLLAQALAASERSAASTHQNKNKNCIIS